MTGRTFTLTWPLDRVNNPNRRGQHWAKVAKYRAEMREAAGLKAEQLAPMHGPVELTVTFTFPDKRPRDLDNYEIKGAIDGAVDAGVITDDRSTILRSVTRRIGAGKAPKGYVVMAFAFTPTNADSDYRNEGGTGTLKASGTAPDLAPEPSLATTTGRSR